MILKRGGAALIALVALGGASPVAELTVSVAGLRSMKGSLQLCLTANPRKFPSCVGDPRAIARTVPATQTTLTFDGLPHGGWAVAVIHDANSNAKLDTMMGIPREGFGFSNNPTITFGAPSFDSARFAIGDSAAATRIKMKYLL